MRVLHVIPSVAPDHGGPSRSVPLLVTALRAEGINVSLAAAGAVGDEKLTLNHLSVRGEILTSESKQKLARAISNSDLVEIHSLWNGTSSWAAGACRHAGVPYVLTPRGMLDPLCVANRSMSKRIYRAVIDGANIAEASGFHFLSEEERERALLGRKLESEQVAISPNGVLQPPIGLPKNFLTTRYPELSGKRVLLHLGRLDPIKRIEFQISALARIPEAERPALLLVGPDYGEERRLRSIARREGVEAWVTFGGSVFGDERFALLAEADLVVLTSLYDCNPVVATEALAVGGAVLATEGCGLRESGLSGAVIVVPANIDDFAQTVRRLLADQVLTDALRKRGRAHADGYLTWHNVVTPLIKLYENLVKQSVAAEFGLAMPLSTNVASPAETQSGISNRALRVLHVSPSFYPATHLGGTITSGLGLCTALGKIPDLSLRVVTTDTNGPNGGERLNIKEFPKRLPGGFDVYYCRTLIEPDISASMLLMLWKLIDWADVVHLNAVYSPPTIPVLGISRLRKKPVVWSTRGSLQRWQGTTKRRLKSAWEQVCNLLCSPGRVFLHATSEQERTESLARIPRAAAFVLPNGVEVPEQSHSSGRQSDRLSLLYLGRLHPIKGIENLLHAVALSDQSVHLSVFGDGDSAYRESLEALVRQLKIGDRVTFGGQIDQVDLKAEMFFAADIVVAPSFSEAFCMVVAEALAHGVPVIASTGTPWQEVSELGCGLWVDNDPATLAKAIEKARSLPLRAMGDRGRQLMKDKYSWSSVAELMAEKYRLAAAQAVAQLT
ncbi:MAG TPA: glycosyltransferase [Pyrinomonadaceae bacterium]|jgi:glycosyltransferase involved in cell wall biosynthesis|nr:glycosyltransferase [Pyrinomonadaceae bacterium]